MTGQWKFAALGALGGAAIAVIIVFGSAVLGYFPASASGESIRAYMTSHPEILAEMMNKLQASQDDSEDRARQLAVDRLGLKSFFNPRVAFIAGPSNAKLTFVEFFDYNCPYCRASIPAVKKFYEAHKSNARFAFIEFPIKGPQSVYAARAAMAARRQPEKYLAFHFLLMNEEEAVNEAIVLTDAKKAGLDVAQLQADMKDPAIDKAIDAAHNLATRARVDGTPAFIINGKMREGAVDDELLAQMIKG